VNATVKNLIIRGLKALGFPSWNTTGRWPASVISAWGDGEPLQLASVYGCARVLCQTGGSVPFHLFREDPKTGVRTKAVDHPLYPLLHDSPNAYMTSMEFREALILGFCLYGNGYAEIVKMGERVTSLNPLRADRMRPMFLPPEYQTLVYRYSHLNGKTEDYAPERILHVRNFSLDGLVGLSPIRKYVIDHALATQSYGRNFMLNGGRPGGYLSFKGKRPANEEYNNKLRSDWQGIHGGPENAGKTAVLWEEGKYEVIAVPPEDAQFIETMKLKTADIAAIFGVPLNMLAMSDKTATYASAEQFAIDFVRHTARPLAVRIEQAFNKGLLATSPGYYCELDLDALQRGDAQAQAAYFSTLSQNGIMTRNEARRKLNLPEVDGADELTVQSNLIDLDKLAAVTNRAAASAGGP
jgi:HK97 family phage portal protein